MALEWRYTYSGTDNGDPDESLGGSMSATQLSATAMNNLFDNITPDEADAGESEYRCLVLYANGEDYTDISIYMNPETSSSYTQIDMALEGINPSSPTTIANEDTAPDQTGWTETTFTHRNSSSKLEISSLSDGDKAYIWFKRTVSAGATATSEDSGTINVDYVSI